MITKPQSIHPERLKRRVYGQMRRSPWAEGNNTFYRQTGDGWGQESGEERGSGRVGAEITPLGGTGGVDT